MLTELQLRQATPRDKDYTLRDGANGLYLHVAASGRRTWRRDFELAGKRSKAVLGTFLPAGAAATTKPLMTLAEARAAAIQHREQTRAGVDPRAEQEQRRQAEQLAAEQERARIAAERERLKQEAAQAKAAKRAAGATLRAIAEEWIEVSRAGWSKSHASVTAQIMRDWIDPKIGHVPVSEVTHPQVLAALESLFDRGRHETARKAWQRLQGVREFALARGHQVPDFIGPLRAEFKRRMRLARAANPSKNFPSVGREQLPGLLRAMRAYGGERVTFHAVWLLAYTLVRTNELRGALWSEVDIEGAQWTIPAERTKSRRVHWVPLSRQAVEHFRALHKLTGENAAGLVVPQTRKPTTPISENAVLVALAAMGYQGIHSGHGYRSIGSTLLHDSGRWRHAAVEAQLAHEVRGQTERAYNKAEHLETRREMMQALADQLDKIEEEGIAGTAKVVAFPTSGRAA